VNLLKIDTEGNDIAVLEGFTATIEHARIAVIQLNMGPHGSHLGVSCMRPMHCLSLRGSASAAYILMVFTSNPTTETRTKTFEWATTSPFKAHCHRLLKRLTSITSAERCGG
jgi:hypothetical protein